MMISLDMTFVDNKSNINHLEINYLVETIVD